MRFPVCAKGIILNDTLLAMPVVVAVKVKPRLRFSSPMRNTRGIQQMILMRLIKKMINLVY
ncbi:MAG: hypothetical protein BWK73_10760 [Thiothrix lacustris]|uniref:Uncharacterized protein n=1 Tax=Thiothrix lacustris TaxID=525917 RepID=A0A1Y1QUA2_9GAMM|nr:MAG: hypothetical protein BWK73_10760 [Thiothrix lacustris]